MSPHGSEVVCSASASTCDAAKEMVRCMLDGHGLNGYDRAYYMSHGRVTSVGGRYTFRTVAMVHRTE